MMVSAAVNSPFLGLAAYLTWPFFGHRPKSSFPTLVICNPILGAMLPVATAFVGSYLIAILSFGFGLGPILLLAAGYIWGSWFFLLPAGALIALVFGFLKEQSGPNPLIT